MNNNLIIFYKDDSKDVFSFSLDTTEEEALAKFRVMRSDVKKDSILRYFFRVNDETPVDVYGNFAKISENNKLDMDLRRLLCHKKIEEVRRKRDVLLSKLDLPFMRALEDDNELVKNHIKSMKNFLRDMPNNLRFEDLEDAEIASYDPFSNIFEILLVHGGSGYTKPPKVTVDAPRRKGVGFVAKALAFIDKGKIIKIELTDYGCGYDFLPLITIESPENGEQAVAFCGPPQNTTINLEGLKANTRKYYS